MPDGMPTPLELISACAHNYLANRNHALNSIIGAAFGGVAALIQTGHD